MKKLAILFFGVALFATSCAKDRTCTCKSSEIGDTDVDTDVTTYKSVTKSFVKNEAGCVSHENKTELGIVYRKVECTIE